MAATALILYAGAEAFSIAHLRTDRRVLGSLASLILFLGFLTHFEAINIGARVTHTLPYHDLPSSMSLFAWMLAGSYGILLLRHREGSTGPFLIPLSILFLAASMLTRSHPGPVNPRMLGPIFAWHVTMAIMGYAALTLSFVLAILYLVQTRQLHSRKQGLLLLRLPALDVLHNLHRTSVATGVLALTVASSLGLVWAKRNWGTYWDPKVLFTFLIITIYLFTLYPGRTGLSGKKLKFVSIGGFVLLMFSYTIVNLFITQEHGFR
jgi:ABC-type transport system involved in cytochrome c biogenesis permease subunit